MTITEGAHHIGLTVPDHEAAHDFFVDVLGFDEVGGKPEYPAIFVSDGSLMVTLWRAKDPATATPFDRKTGIGLHHLALKVSPDAMDGLHEKLTVAAGCTIEFAPEPLNAGPVRHMMCTIPGGIRMEFIAPPSA